MINLLSYVGMSMQSEICLWCIMGLVRSIFDATLFKVNANLKQVWQMDMPKELSMPVQHTLRTMVSGIMLVKCFTVYVYLASYIVLLYPVFLEERPTLVLPWLLLAAVRKLLCELTSLALGLGTCLLLGPAKPPCIKFVVVKLVLIMPAFYMWMLVFSYYHALKVAEAFKTFPANLPSADNDYFDYGLELAVRRRRTKSLLGEAQLRKKLVANLYGDRTPGATEGQYLLKALDSSSRTIISTDTSIEGEGPETGVYRPSPAGLSDVGVYAYEDWFGSEVIIPRDTDRILEQIVLMLLRIGAYLKKEGLESIKDSKDILKSVPASWHLQPNMACSAMSGEITETPPNVGSSKGNIASYLRDYPHIFMKKQGTNFSQSEFALQTLSTVYNQLETDESTTTSHQSNQNEEISSEDVPNKRKISDKDKIVKIALLSESLKAGTSREVQKDENNETLSHRQISNGNRNKEEYQILKVESNSNLSNIKEISCQDLNLSKNKDFTQKNANNTERIENNICKDDKSKDLPLRIQSNDQNFRETKESKKDNSVSNIQLETENKDKKSDDQTSKSNEVDTTESTESHSKNKKKS